MAKAVTSMDPRVKEALEAVLPPMAKFQTRLTDMISLRESGSVRVVITVKAGAIEKINVDTREDCGIDGKPRSG